MKLQWEAEDEKIRVGQFRARSLEDSQHGAIAGVQATPVLLPFKEFVVVQLVGVETGIPQDRKDLRHLAYQSDLIAILQIAADSRRIHLHRDPYLFQVSFRTDPRQHKQLRCIECPAAENHLALSMDLSRSARRAGPLDAGLIEFWAVKIFHPIARYPAPSGSKIISVASVSVAIVRRSEFFAT